jgi:hypothetical protein
MQQIHKFYIIWIFQDILIIHDLMIVHILSFVNKIVGFFHFSGRQETRRQKRDKRARQKGETKGDGSFVLLAFPRPSFDNPFAQA